jgi:hypothetical protein
MEGIIVSQIVVSTAASLLTGVSLLFWASLITKGDWSRLALLREKPIVLIQALLGVLTFAGSVASLALAVSQPIFRGGE